MTDNWIEGIGLAAAACTTLCFIPQLVKIRKQGGRDLSYLMLGIYLAGLFLWLVYGLLLHAFAVIVANSVGIVLVTTAVIMKAVSDNGIATPRYRRQRGEELQ